MWQAPSPTLSPPPPPSIVPVLELDTITRTELCSFSGAKIYPGHGKIVVRSDNKVTNAR